MIINRQPVAARPPARPAQQPPETHEPVDWFHRSTGAVAGAGLGAALGTAVIGPLGNGMGGGGLIYPVMGFLGGAAAGLVGGAVAAGKIDSPAFHRTTAVTAGIMVGSLVGLCAVGTFGNGKGAEGLAYAAAGLVGGGVLGGIALGSAPVK